MKTPSNTPSSHAHRLSVAPMLDWTDRHCRFFLRQLSRHCLLYTEMLSTGAILHGDRELLLGYHPEEHPLSLQVGGDDPLELGECARVAQAWGYDELNLNVGCPSARVQSGAFGACLMKRPEVVAEGVAAMRARCQLPVTVKHRIGVDELDSYEALCHFVSTVAAAGCQTFIVHARKAWLKGLSPKENREVPPLRHEVVYALKRDFPHLNIELNGGVESLDQVLTHLEKVDGVMLGRAAYHRPYVLAEADQRIFDQTAPVPSREAVLARMAAYCEEVLPPGPIHRVARHLHGLYFGELGARAFRRMLAENAWRPEAGPGLLIRAAEAVQRSQVYNRREDLEAAALTASDPPVDGISG